ncbi:MAG TPA: hypothetical protein VJ788_10015 [Gemmatimonadota bacterium]|nr:hypothetical protein [Gemmatimonadota bacterium]
MILLQPVSIWYLRPVLLSLAILGLLFPAVLRVPALWGSFTLLFLAWVIREWPTGDNHHYLFVYWTLAIFLALCMSRPDRQLAASARWLVVGVFLWATLWKAILSPDYMDGRFYRVRLLTDARFASTVQLVGGLTQEDLASSQVYLEPPPYGEPRSTPAALVEPPSVVRLATFLTWATVLLEGLVAVVFLLPWGRWTLGVRHATLLGFCGAAYAIAPVAGFGWLLCAMGVSQVPADRRVLRAAYVAVFLLLRFYMDVPWGRLMREVVTRLA